LGEYLQIVVRSERSDGGFRVRISPRRRSHVRIATS
jgi:hypothetical protein